MGVVAGAGVASAAGPGCVPADDSSWPSARSARADCSHVAIAPRKGSDGSGGSGGLGLGTVTVASGSTLAAATVGAVHS